ncbi:MAG: hypothetical protein KKA62_05635 [Nanoarchaeota archaeon]|nr:hypothetical protein [Nanoarchaeota archaeon]MBU1644692.1 hypothetical protein [Nanoarchaeota archaeon]MBU1977405.1 hypothetical protein [Nanoarchaeota archaeon]
MLSKKGIALSQLVIWLIILVSFVMIAFTIERFISKAEPLEAEIICRDSLALKAKTKIEIGPVEGSTPSLCKTIDKKFSTTKRDEALDWFARSMERCWWIWLEGRHSEIFGPRGLLGSDEKTKCFVCNTLTYNQGPTLTKSELEQYLTSIKSRYKNADVSSYIQERGYFRLGEENFPSDQVYALIFASNIDEGLWKSSFQKLLGVDAPYTQNGLWLMSMNEFDKTKPCYYQPDVAGQ